MPHDPTSRDEAAAISALLDFGSTSAPNGSTKKEATTTKRPPSAVTQPPRNFDTTITDVNSVAVVTSGGSSDGSVSIKTLQAGSKKRSGPEPVGGFGSHLVIAPAPVAATEKSPAKRQRTESKKGDPKQIYIIQDCHAVLGDRHCAGRTTIATVILREIKLKYKEKYKGKGVDNWYDEAMAEYYHRVMEKVPGFTQDDYETVLVYSYSPKGRKDKKGPKASDEIGSSRVEEPNCYKYHTDDFPKYGRAKVPEAVKFFFNSKDAPTLPKEISKYRSDFEKLKMGGKQPPPEKMAFFEDFLKFCEDNLRKAKDEEMAQQLLHSLNLIPTLRRLWDTLKASTHRRGSTHAFTTVAQAVMQANQPSLDVDAVAPTLIPPPPPSSLPRIPP